VRYDLISPRARKDGKTFWVKVGAGFARDKGGFSLQFDALPLPDAEGKVTVLMTEPKDDNRQPDTSVASGDQAPRGGGPMADIDDSIPFACEWRA
jgi:hypothetical protein